MYTKCMKAALLKEATESGGIDLDLIDPRLAMAKSLREELPEILEGIGSQYIDIELPMYNMMISVSENYWKQAISEAEELQPGQEVVLIAGFPIGAMRSANFLLLHEI